MSMIQTCLWITLALFRATEESKIYEKSGTDVTMPCDGTIQQKSLLWKHNGIQVLSVQAKTGRISKGSAVGVSRAKLLGTNLKISSVGSSDIGVYSCTGYDDKNNKITQEHSLYIVSVTESTAVLLHSELTLRCDVTDLTAQVLWLKPPDRQTEAPGKEIILKSVTMEQQGKWTCKISDENGVEKKKIEVEITVVGLLSHKELTVPLGGNAELLCCLSSKSQLHIVEGGWARDPPTSQQSTYLLSLTTKNGLCWTNPSHERIFFQKQPLRTNFSVTLINVQAADAGGYMCSLKFEGQKTLNATLTLKVEGEEVSVQPMLSMNSWVWVAIAAAFVLLIVLAVIIVLFQRRNIRMRRKVKKLKSMRQPLTPRNFCQCNRTERQPHTGRRGRPAPPLKTPYQPVDT